MVRVSAGVSTVVRTSLSMLRCCVIVVKVRMEDRLSDILAGINAMLDCSNADWN